MGNQFVDYLNSMNNATSGNENALAEAQVTNKYYSKIVVEREIGNRIYDKLFSGKPKSVILTGHAGDGKTSLLVQILNKIGYFSQGKKALKEVEVFEGTQRLFYVKDMSELNERDQERNLIEFLKSPSKGISSILISNTGPLINTFKRLIDKSASDDLEYKKELFEGEFLDAIDSVEGVLGNIDYLGINSLIDIVNIANIDNTYFAAELIENICNEELWCKCSECETSSREKCPIYNNIRIIRRQKLRVKEIIEKIYFWLNESESRLTIRQMISHLSYSITGNLTCEEIRKSICRKENPLFTYAFPNLFFGYEGTNIRNESLNIKAIRELSKLKLDSKSLLAPDNNMFVKEDFLDFYDDIGFILRKQLDDNYFDLGLGNKESQKLRRSFRRFYILLCRNEESIDELLKNIFSDVYPLYYKLVTSKVMDWNQKRILSDIVFEGLYKIFVGVFPQRNDKTIYLTLKKNLQDMQNVQMILGYFLKDEIKPCIKSNNTIEKSLKISTPYIQIRNVKYDLTHEFLNYLYCVKNGKVYTSYNPNFTFGISKLKSDLIKECRISEEDIQLLVVKKDKVEKVEMNLSNGQLSISK